MDALVQEADCAERVVVMKVRVPGRTAFVVVGAGGAGLLTSETKKALWGGRLPAGFARQRAREESLQHARVVSVGDAAAWIDAAGDARVVKAHGGRVVVTDEAPPEGARPLPEVLDDDAAREALEARGKAIAEALAGEGVEVRRGEVLRALEKGRARVARRRKAIEEDLAKIAEAGTIASQAQWLVAEAVKAPRGATKLVVTDWSTGEPVPMEVKLDPSKSAKEQVEAMFKRAKRLRLGARVAEDRKAQASAAADAIELAMLAVEEAKDARAIDEAAREAKKAAPRDVSLPDATGGGGGGGPGSAAAKKKEKGRTPFRTFMARSGRKVLVGKGAADNDALTLHVARPHDLWLHANRTGAHVIVQLEKGKTCPSEDMVDAAHLAAHFSEAREEAVVDVQYTEKRHLRKPKGSAPGFVIVDREKVLVLRVDAALVRQLLEREEV